MNALPLAGGWDRTTGAISADLDAEVDQAFANVDANLRHAGGRGWPQVYRVATYSTDIRGTHDAVVRNLRRWMPDGEDGAPKPKPVWTEIGVAALGLDTMHFEIEVEAFDPEGAAKPREEERETANEKGPPSAAK